MVDNFQPLHFQPIYFKTLGELNIKLTPRMSITGNLQAKDFRINIDQFKRPYRDIKIINSRKLNMYKSPKLSVVEDANVHIKLPDDAVVQAKNLDSVWGGSYDLICKEGKWKILGEMKATKGKIMFFGKKMALTRGDIKYDEEKMPKINLEFEKRVDDHTITLIMKGRGHEFRTNVSSDPKLKEQDAYAYLLFGSRSNTLTNFQTAKLFLAIASVSSSQDGFWQRLPTYFDIKQKKLDDGEEDEILRYSIPLNEDETTVFAVEKSLSKTSDISAKIERQISQSVKADIGIASSDADDTNFGGEIGVSFGRNY